MGTRNAPSVLNATFATTLFWDGRATSLETQALGPLLNPVEHALNSSEDAVAVVKRDTSYVIALARAYDVNAAQVSIVQVVDAITSYERALVSGDSPFDRYYFGHEPDAMTAAAIRGLDLFRGKAGCVACHIIDRSSALFTDNAFHVSPVQISDATSTRLQSIASTVASAAQSQKPGTRDDLIGTDSEVAALGRFAVTLEPADIGKFKTPSLRNVALTQPYMHDGSVNRLEDAIVLESYNRSDGVNRPSVLTIDEQKDVLAFLHALTSPDATSGGVCYPLR